MRRLSTFSKASTSALNDRPIVAHGNGVSLRRSNAISTQELQSCRNLFWALVNGVADENVYVPVKSAISCSFDSGFRAGAGLGSNDRNTQSESHTSKMPPDLSTRRGSLSPFACCAGLDGHIPASFMKTKSKCPSGKGRRGLRRSCRLNCQFTPFLRRSGAIETMSIPVKDTLVWPLRAKESWQRLDHKPDPQAISRTRFGGSSREYGAQKGLPKMRSSNRVRRV